MGLFSKGRGRLDIKNIENFKTKKIRIRNKKFEEQYQNNLQDIVNNISDRLEIEFNYRLLKKLKTFKERNIKIQNKNLYKLQQLISVNNTSYNIFYYTHIIKNEDIKKYKNSENFVKNYLESISINSEKNIVFKFTTNHKKLKKIFEHNIPAELLVILEEKSIGCPDFIVYCPQTENFFFIEVKGPNDGISCEQINWALSHHNSNIVFYFLKFEKNNIKKSSNFNLWNTNKIINSSQVKPNQIPTLV